MYDPNERQESTACAIGTGLLMLALIVLSIITLAAIAP